MRSALTLALSRREKVLNAVRRSHVGNFSRRACWAIEGGGWWLARLPYRTLCALERSDRRLEGF